MKGVQLTILQRRPGSTKSAQKGDPPFQEHGSPKVMELGARQA